jgi:DNA-binding NtrC family response regulator
MEAGGRMPATANKFSLGASGRVKPTLLAVSTNQEDLCSLQDILDEDNWTVQHAESCDEAARLMRNQNPEVIACDLNFPDGNWRDLFNLATALENPPPLVVVSRHADESLWAEVLSVGGYDLLAIPFERNEVSRVVAMASRHGRTAPVR